MKNNIMRLLPLMMLLGCAANKGNLRIMAAMRAALGFKSVLSVGGYTLSSTFSWISRYSDLLVGLCESAVRTVKKYTVDGIDFDWEFREDITGVRDMPRTAHFYRTFRMGGHAHLTDVALQLTGNVPSRLTTRRCIQSK